MQQVFAWNQLSLEHHDLPGATALLQLAEIPDTVSPIHDPARVVDKLVLFFDELAAAGDPIPKIWEFVDKTKNIPYLCIQCVMGVERSHSVLAAIMKDRKIDNSHILLHGSYNRRLYQELLRERNLPLENEPLVSVIVSTYKNTNRLRAVYLSMLAQRYSNWELIVVTDGPDAAAAAWFAHTQPRFTRLIETSETKSHWGNCWRQLGIAAAKGEFIVLALDDNYMTPGFIEQMVGQTLHHKASVAVCDCAHHYAGYDVWRQCKALPCYLMATEIVKKIGWNETSVYAEGHFLDAIRQEAEGRIIHVPRMLVVHN